MNFRNLKLARIVSQVLFFTLFVFIFIKSTNPFSHIENFFLRYDPLIFLTHIKTSLLLPIVGLLLLTLVFGRFFCGWICPLGSLIDLLDTATTPVRNAFSYRILNNSSSLFLKKLNRTPPSWFILAFIIPTAFFSPPILQFFHPNVWIVRVATFSIYGIIFLLFLISLSLIQKRFWCRYICPLGALYGLFGKISFFTLSIKRCARCDRCEHCPMGAIDPDTMQIIRHQCTLCFDFEYRCPAKGFAYRRHPRVESAEYNESRRRFLISMWMSITGLIGGSLLSFFNKTTHTKLLRPPGVINESLFVSRCLRCFQCVESCPNDIIKITTLETGFNSFMTPHLDFTKEGCDYYCQVCQKVCPNFAIPLQTLVEKQHTKLGLAYIDQAKCIVYTKDTNCLVCEEFCPTVEKAILVTEKEKRTQGGIVTLRYPTVDESRCIGCGICEARCPVEPRAITISRIF